MKKHAVLIVCFFVYASSTFTKADDAKNNELTLDLIPSQLDDAQSDMKRNAGMFRYGKRAAPFRYGKRRTPFRYGKRLAEITNEDEHEPEDARLSQLKSAKRSDSSYKRVFRWGKRDQPAGNSPLIDILADGLRKRGRAFRYGKREAGLFGIGAARLLSSQYARDTREPQQPHTPFRFGEK